MKKSSRRGDSTTEVVKEEKLRVEIPEILDKVVYSYSNHARLSANKWDIRIAFGDLGPTGEVRPVNGIVLPHLTAKGLLAALARMVEVTEKRLGGPIEDPDDGKIEIQIDAPRPV